MRKSLLPPHAKYIISSPTSAFPDLDVSFDVASWEDLDVILERDRMSGVLGHISFPIRIALKGRELLKSLFEQDQFHAKAIFSIYTRASKISGMTADQIYTHAVSLRLDFTTYVEDDHYVEIEGVAADLIEYIHSYGKNKYDIPVAEISETTKWEYQRMQMLNQGSWFPVPGTNQYSNTMYYQLPLYLDSSQTQMAMGSAHHDMKDQAYTDDDDNPYDYFFKAVSNVRIAIDAKFTIRKTHVSPQGWGLQIRKNGVRNGEIVLDLNANNSDVIHEDTTKFPPTFIDLTAGDTLSLVAFDSTVWYAEELTIEDHPDNKFTIKYFASGPVLSGDEAIPVIDPQNLMQAFLDKMTGTPNHFTCKIDWQDEPVLIKLVVGESLRGYPNRMPNDANDNKVAYLHGSPNDLVDFLHVLGYDWEINDSVIRFKRRDEFFRRDVTAVRLTEREVSEFKIIANQEHAYTKVLIGCEKQDYDSINGPFESNFVHEYLTEHRNITDKVLDLTSPYRTDPIGIELTTWERINLTTDKKADSDIFAVALRQDGGKYVEDMSIYSEDTTSKMNSISSPFKMFNAYFNPYYLMKRNESLIGIIAREARFTSNEGSKNAVIRTGAETVDPRQNIQITKKLHEPVMYDFEVGFQRALPMSDVWNGLVYIPYRGKMYRGFIADIGKNHGHEKQENWGLWAVMD